MYTWLMLCCSGLREAALECLEEVHRHLGEALVPALQALDDPPRNLPLLQARLQDAGGAALPEPDLLAASCLSAALQQEHSMLLPSQGDAPGATGGAYMADVLSDRSAEVGRPCAGGFLTYAVQSHCTSLGCMLFSQTSPGRCDACIKHAKTPQKCTLNPQ